VILVPHRPDCQPQHLAEQLEKYWRLWGWTKAVQGRILMDILTDIIWQAAVNGLVREQVAARPWTFAPV
jgi:hypothetical protein